MGRNRRKSKGKKINPPLYVFCEGEPEEDYVNMIKTVYRIPSIQIRAKVRGNKISKEFIKRYKLNIETHPKDLDFLMYDLDVDGFLKKLQDIPQTMLLVSNPCIELWFLLHEKAQKSNINTTNCCNEIKKRFKGYEKGTLNEEMKKKLKEKQSKAIRRAKELTKFGNPSSTIYLLIELLESLKESNR